MNVRDVAKALDQVQSYLPYPPSVLLKYINYQNELVAVGNSFCSSGVEGVPLLDQNNKERVELVRLVYKLQQEILIKQNQDYKGNSMVQTLTFQDQRIFVAYPAQFRTMLH